MRNYENDPLWVNRYAPKTVEACVLPDRIKSVFLKFVEDGHCPNILLAGSAGSGKTSIAKALAADLKSDLLFINASLEGNIDTLRTKILNFASTVSFTNEKVKKIVILDEIDGANSRSFQPALRAFTEEFSGNCAFILTCNFKKRVMEPIHSRCTVIDFDFTSNEKVKMQASMFKRILDILEKEQITVDKKALAETVKKFFPDFRRLLNELQKYSTCGAIDTGILASVGSVDMNEIMSMLAAKNFKGIRKWAANTSDIGDTAIFRALYDSLYDYMKPSSIPQAVLIIAEYSYKSAFVADPEINMTAAMVTIMSECEFKEK